MRAALAVGRRGRCGAIEVPPRGGLPSMRPARWFVILHTAKWRCAEIHNQKYGTG